MSIMCIDPKHAIQSLVIWKSKQVGGTEHLELTALDS